jgi:hypothetical protein
MLCADGCVPWLEIAELEALTRRQQALVVAFVAAVALFWVGARGLARHLLGTPGFEVVTFDRAGAQLAVRHTDLLFTPENLPGPPVAGSLRARASFAARTAGEYTWKLGGTTHVVLRVDGKEIFAPRPGLVYDYKQTLTAGIHALEVVMTNADENGAVVLAIAPPSAWWVYDLVDADYVTDAPADVVARRWNARSLAHIAPGTIASTLTLLFLALALLACGARRRRQLPALSVAFAESKVGAALLLIALALPLLRHFFDPGYVICHEGESYTVRFVEYADAIRQGVPMGRWWPDPVLGRGYPFLCLYAPLLYILATPLLLLGVAPMISVKIISAALVLVGMTAIFATARRRASQPAAFVALALFTYAPYLQTDLWIRADIAESLGFACFPCALWALERALDGGDGDARLDIAYLALSLAAVGSCHNITAYFAVYCLGAWLLTRLAMKTVSREGFRRTLLGALLGLSLTVFYAVPAIGDANRVWIMRVMIGYYDSLRNLVPFEKLLFPTPKWGMRTFLGLPATLALVAGVAAMIYASTARRRAIVPVVESRRLALPALCATLLALALATRPLGWFVIKFVPLAGYVQFPWRMFLFAACTAPLCAPIAVDTFFTTARSRWLLACVVTGLVMAFAVPQYGPEKPLVRVHINTQPYLRSINTDYVTSMNEYLPKTVARTVPVFSGNAHVVLGQARLTLDQRSAGRYTVDVDATGESIIEFNAHWFPGWKAFVDRQSQEIGPKRNGFDAGGLIRVRVPAGHHSVAIVYGRTPLRAVCDLLSLLALLVTLALIAAASWSSWRGRNATAPKTQAKTSQASD